MALTCRSPEWSVFIFCCSKPGAECGADERRTPQWISTALKSNERKIVLAFCGKKRVFVRHRCEILHVEDALDVSSSFYLTAYIASVDSPLRAIKHANQTERLPFFQPNLFRVIPHCTNYCYGLPKAECCYPLPSSRPITRVSISEL